MTERQQSALQWVLIAGVALTILLWLATPAGFTSWVWNAATG